MEKTKKRKIAVVIVAVLVIIAAAAAAVALYAGSKKSDAVDAALAHAGVTRQEAAMIQSEVDFDGLSMSCDVSFKTSDCDYDYKVSLPGLEIIDFEKEYYGNSGGQNNTSSGSDVQNNPGNQDTAQQSGQPAGSAAAVSEETARETVLAHAQVGEADLQFYRSNIDTDHGTSKYEIEFTAGGYEYDYEVDCTSGEILKFEKEKMTQ